jgi:endonuclease YncB( thermonuclease family)
MQLILATLLLATLLLPNSANAATFIGVVVGVSDGDTIKVVDASNTQHKIRLLGIDAPESKQAFGQRSKQSLSDIVYGRTVHVEYDKQDRYGRTLGKVLVDGEDANLLQVKRGMAWWYRAYKRDQNPDDQKIYEAAENAAKASKMGLWADMNSMPPWVFRKKRN